MEDQEKIYLDTALVPIEDKETDKTSEEKIEEACCHYF